MKCAIQTLKVLLVRKVVSWVTFQTCQIITLWGGDRPDLPSWDSIWRDSKINISYTKDLQSCHFHFLFSWFLLDRPLCKNAVQADSYLNSAYLLNQLLWLLVEFRDLQCKHQFAAGVLFSRADAQRYWRSGIQIWIHGLLMDCSETYL